MTEPNSDKPKRVVPKCMRLIEESLPLPHGGLQALLCLLKGDAMNRQSLTKSQLEALAIQTWRLGRRVEGLPDGEEGRTKRQLKDSYNRFAGVLQDLDISIDDPIGRAYTDGWLEVDVIAWEDPDGPAPEGVSDLWVKQTIKPILKQSGRLLAKGEIVVADSGKT